MSKHSKTAVRVTPASRVAEFGSRTTEVSEQDTAQFTYKRNAAELGRFCRGEPRNFANWSAEFGKIFHGKLWALIISNNNYIDCAHFKNTCTLQMSKVEVKIKQ